MRNVVFTVGLAMALSSAWGCDEKKEPSTETTSAATVAATGQAATAEPAAKPPLSQLIAKTMKNVTVAWNSHDPKLVAANYPPNGVLRIPGLPDMTGRDAISAEAQRGFTGFSDFKIAMTRSFLKDHMMVVEWVVTGTNTGEFMGQKATNRPVGINGASVLAFDDDGLIKEDHRYFDMPTMTNQLDAKAKAGTFRAPVALPTAAIEEHVAKGTPDEAKTLEQGNAIEAAFETKKEATFLPLVTDDYVWEEYPSQGPTKGATELKTVMGGYNKAMPDWTLPTTLQIAVDGYYVVEGALTGTKKGALGANKATNKPVSLHLVDIQLIKDGKESREWSYSNSAEMLIELGVMPPIAAPGTTAAAVPAAGATAAPIATGAATAAPPKAK